jgi:copper chaperone
MRMTIPDMTCGHCRATVETAVAAAAPGARVTVDLDSRTAVVDGAADEGRVLAAVRDAGFDARLA